jgi:hypothetical protein
VDHTAIAVAQQASLDAKWLVSSLRLRKWRLSEWTTQNCSVTPTGVLRPIIPMRRFFLSAQPDASGNMSHQADALITLLWPHMAKDVTEWCRDCQQ